MSAPTLIKARDGGPCTCGCAGRDPWHATHYRRVVRGLVEERRVLDDGRIRLAFGVARFPWGFERVVRIARVVDGAEHVVGWEVVRG